MSRVWEDDDLWPARDRWAAERPVRPVHEGALMIGALILVVVAILVGLSIGQAQRYDRCDPTIIACRDRVKP